MVKERLSRRVQVGFTDAQMKAVEQAASERGMSVSAYLRSLAMVDVIQPELEQLKQQKARLTAYG